MEEEEDNVWTECIWLSIGTSDKLFANTVTHLGVK
jgi:hypothetical protein